MLLTARDCPGPFYIMEIDMIDITGTTSSKLIAYIDRVAAHLGLDDYDTYFELAIVKQCDAMAGGFAYGDDETVCVEIARNDSQGKVPMKDMMINIAHELIHAQQLASGRLVDNGMVLRTTDEGEALSISRKFDGVEYVDLAYDDQPWEIEAYANEEKVYDACC